jgi:hypothetical protein
MRSSLYTEGTVNWIALTPNPYGIIFNFRSSNKSTVINLSQPTAEWTDSGWYYG